MSVTTRYKKDDVDIGTFFCDLTNDQTVKGTKTFETTPVVGTKASDNSSTSAASTAYVKNQAYATLASPTFTGTVLLPAPTANTKQAATTEFVKSAVDALSISSYAPKDAPTFTGNVIVGTTTSTSNGNIYLTSYSTGITGCNIYFYETNSTVKGRIFSSGGVYIDTAQFTVRDAGGTTTYLQVTSSGTVTVPAPTDGNSTQVATTAWVKTQIPAATTAPDLSSYVTKTFLTTTLGSYNPFGIDYQGVATNPSIALANDSVNIFWFTDGTSSTTGIVSCGDSGAININKFFDSCPGTVTTFNNNISHAGGNFVRYRVIRII